MLAVVHPVVVRSVVHRRPAPSGPEEREGAAGPDRARAGDAGGGVRRGGEAGGERRPEDEDELHQGRVEDQALLSHARRHQLEQGRPAGCAQRWERAAGQDGGPDGEGERVVEQGDEQGAADGEADAQWQQDPFAALPVEQPADHRLGDGRPGGVRPAEDASARVGPPVTGDRKDDRHRHHRRRQPPEEHGAEDGRHARYPEERAVRAGHDAARTAVPGAPDSRRS